MFDQTSKLRSMATNLKELSSHIDFDNNEVFGRQAGFSAASSSWSDHWLIKCLGTVVTLGLCIFESRKTAFLTSEKVEICGI